LLKDWDEKLLGNNPFVSIGICSGDMSLVFESETLAYCPSKQLQMVAGLSHAGKIKIGASGAPFMGVDAVKTDNNDYDLQVMTVAENTSNNLPQDKDYTCQIRSTSGCVGHAVLKYRTGGCMVISAGHWISLNNITVDIKTLEKIAQENYGEEYMNEINEIKKSFKTEAKKKEPIRPEIMENRVLEEEDQFQRGRGRGQVQRGGRGSGQSQRGQLKQKQGRSRKERVENNNDCSNEVFEVCSPSEQPKEMVVAKNDQNEGNFFDNLVMELDYLDLQKAARKIEKKKRMEQYSQQQKEKPKEETKTTTKGECDDEENEVQYSQSQIDQMNKIKNPIITEK